MLITSVAALLTLGGAVWLLSAPSWLDGPRQLMVVDEAWAAPADDAGVLHRVEEPLPWTGPRHVSLTDTVQAVKTSEAVNAPQAPPAKPQAISTKKPAAAPMSFDARPIRPVKTIRMLVTAYSPDERSCGKFADNITASGYSVWTNGMRLAAADRKLLPFGTILTVPGYNDGRPIPVLDVGGAIKGHRLDVLYATHEQARKWGQKWLTVTVWEYADR